MDENNTMKLINAIKLRPALYNQNDPMYYSYKKFKDKMWREVCEAVYQNWVDMTPEEKLSNVQELQMRWKSLRTCFSREIGYQKREKLQMEHKQPVRRRKKYEYFNDLVFLLDSAKVTECVNINSGFEDDPLDAPYSATLEESLDVEEDSSKAAYENSNNAASSNIIKNEPFEEAFMYDRVTLDDKMLDILKSTKESENDEDRQFCLSMVSLFRNLTVKEKLEARIGVLKVLQTINCREDE